MDYKETLLMPKTAFPMRGDCQIKSRKFKKNGKQKYLSKSIRPK